MDNMLHKLRVSLNKFGYIWGGIVILLILDSAFTYRDFIITTICSTLLNEFLLIFFVILMILVLVAFAAGTVLSAFHEPRYTNRDDYRRW